MGNVIPVRFPQPPAIRCIAREASAEVHDFLAIKVARQVCPEDEIELVARIIHARVVELRQELERQADTFNLFGRSDPRNG